MARFSELIKNLSDVPKSEIFVFFTKIIATTTNKIIPVSIALEKDDDDGRKRGNFVNKPRQ